MQPRGRGFKPDQVEPDFSFLDGWTFWLWRTRLRHRCNPAKPMESPLNRKMGKPGHKRHRSALRPVWQTGKAYAPFVMPATINHRRFIGASATITSLSCPSRWMRKAIAGSRWHRTTPCMSPAIFRFVKSRRWRQPDAKGLLDIASLDDFGIFRGMRSGHGGDII